MDSQDLHIYNRPLIKICGLQSTLAAQTALDNGADLLGVIMVPNRKRSIDLQISNQIYQLVKLERERRHQLKNIKKFKIDQFFNSLNSTPSQNLTPSFKNLYMYKKNQLIHHGPFLVAVFQNQSIDQINHLINHQLINFDIIQLHGSEDKLSYTNSNLINKPIISRYLMSQFLDLNTLKDEISLANNHLLILLDSDKGGEGQLLDWNLINSFFIDNSQNPLLSSLSFILAGGLNIDNISNLHSLNGLIGLDVSSGVESNGIKDLEKIKTFIKIASNIPLNN
ncbi:phosphoribosylanthranilate isomerase TRP1 ASCRUDRAFT_37292 [Ascoidea rubescens DSM 1968]|uniref:N-(5'-phosphoribosyl)anthranilate isomerase n=1 Tax=Ascoidea rubescens DSM 1968 TaxID=1344418 RepID=A0A1D2VDS8_9ASCO|nr:hypothetical protein ASCRUDRAFT_37292 [Ascoidea rubescens DSM 1968]ODV59742.1 hypothetical protein ASCRUDRAFT_37292 [Ascoidea rubescens DSM 1968]